MVESWSETKATLSGIAANRAKEGDPMWAIAFALMELADEAEFMARALQDISGALGDLAETKQDT